MMVRISRYILVLVAVMAAAATLTQLYWMVFEKPVRAPLSCTVAWMMTL